MFVCEYGWDKEGLLIGCLPTLEAFCGEEGDGETCGRVDCLAGGGVGFGVGVGFWFTWTSGVGEK